MEIVLRKFKVIDDGTVEEIDTPAVSVPVVTTTPVVVVPTTTEPTYPVPALGDIKLNKEFVF